MREDTKMSGNPFPGLRAFRQDETKLFFGREGQSNELLKRLQKSRFLALVGVSGSGKSSLVRAGLLHDLNGGLMSAVESDWRVAVFRPGNSPIGNMAHALITQAKLGSGEPGLEDVEIAVSETTLRRGDRGLLELIRRAKTKTRKDGRPFLNKNENILIVVDQFEEIFRIIEQHEQLIRLKQKSEGNSDLPGTTDNQIDHHPKEEASAFVKLLLEASGKDKHGKYPENIYVIVTMRSDYLGDTAQFGGMPERINEGQYLIPRMDRDDRRKAIVGPIAVGKGSITEPLINQLLNDAGENPGHLPILQHALMRMWDLAGPASQTNGGLNLDHYEKIGKLSGALSQHVNEAFNELSDEHQKLAAKVFKCLTEKGLANREIRRPMTIADICDVVDAKEKDVKTVVECFRKEGRWFLMPPPVKDKKTGQIKDDLGPRTLIDISHESLISGWDKLRQWVNEEAESARTYKRLADTAILKELGKEDFYDGVALDVALEWQKDNKPNEAWARRYHPQYDKAIAFLNDSLKDAQKKEKAEKDRAAKELRRTRTYNTILGILAVMFLVLGVFFVGLQRRMSNTEIARQVERAEGEAKQRALAATREEEALRLKKVADDERDKAQGLARDLKVSLDKQEIAATTARKAEAAARKAESIAREAEGIAITERQNAENLQKENKEQATTNEYFKTAFSHVAAQDYDKAAASLKNALAYYVGKEKQATKEEDKQANKDNQFSTLINIGDVYRSAKTSTKDRLALQEYENALKLIGDANTEQRAQALKKAGSVWKDSEKIALAQEAAEYYEEAAKVYNALEQNPNRSSALMEAGRIRARFFNSEANAEKALQDFSAAVRALGSTENVTAPARAEIGEIYLKLVEKDAEKDDEDEDSTTAAEDAVARDSAPKETELSEEVVAENRARSIGASFFYHAADDYAVLGEAAKAAEMKKQAGVILSGHTRQLESAKIAFDEAATMYARIGKTEEQKDVLLEAGGLFVKSTEPFGRGLADYFYQQVVALAKTNDEKVTVLTDIAESYEGATDLTLRRKAVDYYEKSSALYGEMNQKRDEADALVSAGSVLRDLTDDESKKRTTELYERAIAIYQDEPKEQAKTLKAIGDSYDDSQLTAKKLEAIPYYRRAATVARPVDKTQEVSALIQAGRTLMVMDRAEAREQATRFFEEAVSAYQGDVARQTITLSRIASLYGNAEPPQKQNALTYHERAISFAHDQNNKAAEVNAIFSKARSVENFKETDAQRQIEQLYDRAIAVYNDDPANQVDTLIRIARTVMGPREKERVVKAELYLTRALNIANAQPDRKIGAYAHLNIGSVYQATGALRGKAEQHYRDALSIYESVGDQHGQAMALYHLIAVDRDQAVNLADRALPLFVSALPALKAAGDQRQLLDAYYAMGSMYYRQKEDYPAALDSFKKALEICRTLPDQAFRINIINTQIRVVQQKMARQSK